MMNYQEKTKRALKWALGISIAAHALLLAVRFVAPETFRLKSTDQQLEIVLVNSQTQSRPNQPKVLAQANQEGGGNTQTGRATSPLPNSGEVVDGNALQTTVRKQKELEQLQRKLLSQLKSTATLIPDTNTGKAEPNTKPINLADALSEMKKLARMEAQIEERIKDYNAIPTKRFIGIDAQSQADAAYLKHWQTKIERIGTNHFPADENGRIYGSARVTAYLKKDGTIDNIEIEPRNLNPGLEKAIRKILREAQPFAVIPDVVLKGNDQLVVTRQWNFVNDQLSTKQ